MGHPASSSKMARRFRSWLIITYPVDRWSTAWFAVRRYLRWFCWIIDRLLFFIKRFLHVFLFSQLCIARGQKNDNPLDSAILTSEENPPTSIHWLHLSPKILALKGGFWCPFKTGGFWMQSSGWYLLTRAKQGRFSNIQDLNKTPCFGFSLSKIR